MKKYLIDVNLPRYFALWRGEEYKYVIDMDAKIKDSQIWSYAKDNNFTIITKDTDFSDLMLFNEPPPRVIHIKLGNMKIREFYEIISKIWDEVLDLSIELRELVDTRG